MRLNKLLWLLSFLILYSLLFIPGAISQDNGGRGHDISLSLSETPDNLNIENNLTISVNIQNTGSFTEDDIIVNFYEDDVLISNQLIDLNIGESVLLYFNYEPSSLFGHTLIFDAEPVNDESYLENNVATHEIWIYNYDDGFVINEDNTVFDCSNQSNPTGNPIEIIVGTHSTNSGYGIAINGPLNNIIIKDCIIAGWFAGIGTGGYYFVNLTIINNTLFENNYGLYSSAQFHNSKISDNTIYNSSSSGIFVQGINRTTIDNNYLYDNNVGLRVTDSSVMGVLDTNITNNFLVNNLIGINFYSNYYDWGSIIHNNLIKNNSLFNHSLRGIWIYGIVSQSGLNNNNIFEYNNIVDNYGIGIVVSDSTSIIIRNNFIYNTQISDYDGMGYAGEGEGIYITDDSFTNYIYENNITYNEGYGIYIVSSNGDIITSNNILGNDVGIYISGLSWTDNNDFIIDNNVICNNQDLDFYCNQHSTVFEGSINNFDVVSVCSNNWPIYGEDYCYCDEVWNEDLGECVGVETCDLGDINDDNSLNVLDVVQLVNCILADNCDSLATACSADLNVDGIYNILDVILLIEVLLGGQEDTDGPFMNATWTVLENGYTVLVEAWDGSGIYNIGGTFYVPNSAPSGGGHSCGGAIYCNMTFPLEDGTGNYTIGASATDVNNNTEYYDETRWFEAP